MSVRAYIIALASLSFLFLATSLRADESDTHEASAPSENVIDPATGDRAKDPTSHVDRKPAVEEDSIRVDAAAPSRSQEKALPRPPSFFPLVGEDDAGL